ncbi:MAG: hypothetical protein H0T73_11950 [Ardenticatenales bacterium]|nr:hypothetical protein [Ardenticatenales bacterium]
MKIGFVTTSFGFGPVAKAVYVALALQARHLSEVHLTFIGQGIAYEYAQSNDCFDTLVEHNVDHDPDMAVTLLEPYDLIINVMNLDVLARWTSPKPMIMIDSLGWLWHSIPDGTEKAALYFLQDYLLPAERIEAFHRVTNTRVIPPIMDWPTVPTSKENVLLVNFSGSDNPFVQSTFFTDYAEVVGKIILEAAGTRFDHIYFATNRQLAAHLERVLSPSQLSFSCGYYSHEAFLDLLGRCRLLLTTPGITTTLEAMALRVDIGFLLPQNYSQALMAESYFHQHHYAKCIALSRFDAMFALDSSLPEEIGVQRVQGIVEVILNQTTHRIMLTHLVTQLLEESERNLAEIMQIDMHKEVGQQIIVNELVTTFLT